MTDVPDYLDRSRTADFHLTLRVSPGEDHGTLAGSVTRLLGGAMLHREPAVTPLMPDRAVAFTGADADRALAEQLQPMSEGELAAFRLLKAHAAASDGRLLMVRVQHQGRNRALIVLAQPVGSGAFDLHALAMLADHDLLAEVTPAT